MISITNPLVRAGQGNIADPTPWVRSTKTVPRLSLKVWPPKLGNIIGLAFTYAYPLSTNLILAILRKANQPTHRVNSLTALGGPPYSSHIMTRPHKAAIR